MEFLIQDTFQKYRIHNKNDNFVSFYCYLTCPHPFVRIPLGKLLCNLLLQILQFKNMKLYISKLLSSAIFGYGHVL